MSALEVFYNKLLATGLPVAYEHFEEENAPTMPFLCYTEISPVNTPADGVVYYSDLHAEVQLFTKKKDPAKEALVEGAISDYFWSKEGEYQEDEYCYRVIYQMAI